MRRNRTICPFNQRACIDCVLYRGRHQCNAPVSHINDAEVLNEIQAMLTPKTSLKETGSNIKILYVNIEDCISKEVQLAELQDLDWDNNFFVRKIDGIHIHSWETLLGVLKYKEETEGKDFVEFIEAPGFMLYGGG
ncbi:MAG: hypothetical protein FWG92_03600 [Leptospirales bacterium]|nr:hypothetical protein [Leptospirales bacterium]